jgi:hypothetical protein
MEVTGQIQALAAFAFPPPEGAPLYPLDRRLGGAHSRSGHCVEENDLIPARN